MAKILIKHHTRLFLLALLVLLTGLTLTRDASAGLGENPVIIRDTEIENTLKSWAEPVIKGAGLDPQAIHIILVQHPDINAFVMGGPNIFIYTGLLERSESPSEVIGVIAHELGHIRGGHLINLEGANKNASYESIIGTVLGIGAALATGNGDIGSAVMLGSQGAAISRLLSFSRVQESSADQAALSYMEAANLAPGGLLSFLKKMESQELLPASQQNQYIRTHPMTRDRVTAMAAGFERSAYKDQTTPPLWQEQHDRLLAKLKGFINPEQVNWDYSDRDHRIAADYARAIAAYRQNKVEDALHYTDSLIEREPENPYFLELKGQMLVDFSRVEAALPYYQQAVSLLGEAPLIRIAYAHALIESAYKDETRLDKAIKQLNRARQDEPRSGRLYRLLATAHGRRGEEPLAKLYLAEEALLKQQTGYARRQAKAALTGLEEGSGPWLRARDILQFIEQKEKKR